MKWQSRTGEETEREEGVVGRRRGEVERGIGGEAVVMKEGRTEGENTNEYKKKRERERGGKKL